MESRHQFRKVLIQGRCLLYPVPVQKDLKYLVEIPEKFSEFYLFSLENHFLESFDTKIALNPNTTMHTDNQTLIYQIDYTKLFFDLLKNKNHDPEKAEVISNLLNKRLIQYLSQQINNSDSIIATFEKQRKCSTCETLGINNPLLIKLFDLIPR